MTGFGYGRSASLHLTCLRQVSLHRNCAPRCGFAVRAAALERFRSRSPLPAFGLVVYPSPPMFHRRCLKPVVVTFWRYGVWRVYRLWGEKNGSWSINTTPSIACCKPCVRQITPTVPSGCMTFVVVVAFKWILGLKSDSTKTCRMNTTNVFPPKKSWQTNCT